MKAIRPLAVILCMIFAAAGALAQSPAGEARQRLRENINVLRLMRMTQALDLTEGQTSKIYPVFNRIEKEKTRLQRQLSDGLRILRTMLRQTPLQEEEILRAVENLRDLQAMIREKDAEFESFLDDILTPVQKGRYLLFLVDFYRGLGENLEKLREGPRTRLKRDT